MSPKLMIWLSVILSAVAQIFLKQGLSSLQKRRAGADPGSIILGVVRDSVRMAVGYVLRSRDGSVASWPPKIGPLLCVPVGSLRVRAGQYSFGILLPRESR